MYFLVGAAMVFCASVYIGVTAASVLRLRVRQLEAFCSFIGHIGTQIDVYLAPLDTIYRSFDDKQLEKCGFLAAIRCNSGEKALEICRNRLYITESELTQLRDFFSGLGNGLAPHEVKHCLYYEKRLGESARAAREELTKKSRLYRSLGMLIGIMLTIIFL